MHVPIVIAIAVMLLVPSSATAATATVDVGDFSFRPDYTRIEPGDSVTWTMLEGSPHTVTSEPGAPVPFDSGELLPGQQFSQAFPDAGRYPYLCELHPFMAGVVQVGPDTTPPVLSKLFAKAKGKRVWVAFRLSEDSRVSASVASVKRPAKKLRKTRAVKKGDGRQSISVRIGGLKPGAYRVTLVAKDPEGNQDTASKRFRIPKPKK